MIKNGAKMNGFWLILLSKEVKSEKMNEVVES